MGTIIALQFAQRDEWTALCDALAKRLMTGGNTLAATLCYICAGNIDGTVEIWSRNLKAEQEGKTYVDLLQVSSYVKTCLRNLCDVNLDIDRSDELI